VKADTSAAAIVTPAEAPVDPSLDFGHRLRRRPDIVPIEHRRRYRLESVGAKAIVAVAASMLTAAYLDFQLRGRAHAAGDA